MFNFGIFLIVFDISIRFSTFNLISSDNLPLNCKSLEYLKTMNEKLILMLLSTSSRLV